MASGGIVEKVRPRLPHHRDRSGGTVEECRIRLEHQTHGGVIDRAQARRIGKQDGGAEAAGLAYVTESRHLAVAIEGEIGGVELLAREVAVVGQNRGHAGAHRTHSHLQGTVAFDQGHVTNAHPRDIGDGVGGSRRQLSNDYAKIAQPRPLARNPENRGVCQGQQRSGCGPLQEAPTPDWSKGTHRSFRECLPSALHRK